MIEMNIYFVKSGKLGKLPKRCDILKKETIIVNEDNYKKKINDYFQENYTDDYVLDFFHKNCDHINLLKLVTEEVNNLNRVNNDK